MRSRLGSTLTAPEATIQVQIVRHRCMVRRIRDCGFLIVLMMAMPGSAAERVLLQTQWNPGFQTPGYYAALWQDIPAWEAQDVKIRSSATADAGGSRFDEESLPFHPIFGFWSIRVIALVFGALVLLLAWLRIRDLAGVRASQVRLHRNEALLREVESLVMVGGWRISQDENFREISDQACCILGVSLDQGIANLEDMTRHLETVAGHEFNHRIRKLLRQGGRFEMEAQLGERAVWVRIVASVVSNHKGGSEILGAIQDITREKQAEEIISYQANYDALTGLPNRNLFRDRLEKAMVRADRARSKLALLFVDLDNFKAVNDNFGHAAGDEVLIQTAKRLRQCVRDADTVARHSGDEFTLIVHDLDPDSAIYRIIESIVAAVAQPIDVAGSQAYCGASVGVALYPGDATDASTLLVNADQAMYEVKKTGRNGWHFYTSEMQEKSDRRTRVFNELVAAIKADEVGAHLQPIIDLRSGCVVGCEALARWQKADGSWVSPAEFVSVAEESTLVNQLDHRVFERALSSLQSLNTMAVNAIALSINVSPRLFFSKDQSLTRWLELLEQFPGAGKVSIEITERLIVDDVEAARTVLDRFVAAGVGISIDDFGTGNSALSYLARFPVNTVKIDRSFVRGIGVSKTEEALIGSIVAMAHALGIGVVAEGVESLPQLDFLRAAGCDYAQGYHIGKPMPETEFRAFLAELHTSQAIAGSTG